MKVKNAQKDAHPANLTLDELGQAMSTLDLSSVPPEKRASAVLDHLARIMGETIKDPVVASEIRQSRQLHFRRRIGLV